MSICCCPWRASSRASVAFSKRTHAQTAENQQETGTAELVDNNSNESDILQGNQRRCDYEMCSLRDKKEDEVAVDVTDPNLSIQPEMLEKGNSQKALEQVFRKMVDGIEKDGNKKEEEEEEGSAVARQSSTTLGTVTFGTAPFVEELFVKREARRDERRKFFESFDERYKKFEEEYGEQFTDIRGTVVKSTFVSSETVSRSAGPEATPEMKTETASEYSEKIQVQEAGNAGSQHEPEYLGRI